jgi:hypothetical protein
MVVPFSLQLFMSKGSERLEGANAYCVWLNSERPGEVIFNDEQIATATLHSLRSAI